MSRLNWGCGLDVAEGWVNSDRNEHGQDHVGDILEGLPFGDATFAMAVAHHALDMLTYDETLPALAELRRVLVPGGVLRISSPDIEGAYRAALRGDHEWFSMIEGRRPVEVKLGIYLTWHGTRRSLWTRQALRWLLLEAGFTEARSVAYQRSPLGPAIVELDRRPLESIYVEGVR